MIPHLTDDQLNGYIHLTLTDAQRETMDAHLVACPHCRARLAAFERVQRQIRDGLAGALRAARPSDRVRFAAMAPRLKRARRWVMFRSQTARLASAGVLLVAVVALALALSGLLSGQSKPSLPHEGITITFACQDYQHDWYQELADKFHKTHPSILVQIKSADEILDQTISGGVGTVSSDDIYKLARAVDTFPESSLMLGARPQDVALNLADLAAHDGEFDLDDFFPAPLALFQSEDKLWGLPFEVNSFFIFYHPDLFDQAGVAYPQIGWTWEDLLEKAAQLTVREGEVVKRYGFVDPWFRYTLSALAHQKAGSLIKTDHGFPEARLDDPGVVAAVRWYADLALAHGVMLDPTTVDQAALQVLAHEQPLPMWVAGSWEWDNWPEKVGVVPLPEEAGQAATSISAYGYLVSAGTAQPEAAWRWVSFLSQQLPFRYAGGVPAHKSVIAQARYWDKMSPETAAAFQYCLEHAIHYPGAIGWGLGRAFEAVLQGSPAQEALAEAQAAVNERLIDAAAAAESPPTRVAVATPEPTPTPGGMTIRFHVLLGSDLDLYRSLAERFQSANPGIHIELDTSSDWPLAAQASEADCFLGYATGVRAATESLLALDPLIAADKAFNLGVFPPAFLESVRANGTLWGLPLETDALLLYYNRDLWDRAGQPYPAADWTPGSLIARALALADPLAPEPVYGFYPRQGAYIDAATFVAWLGGRLFDAGGRPTFDDPTAIEAMAAYADLIARASPPQAQERFGDRLSGYTIAVGDHPGPIRSGQVAMWSASYDDHRRALALPFGVGVAPFPAGAVPFDAASWALYISAGSAHPQACWDWIAYLSAQPEAVSLFPSRRDVAESETWRARTDGESVAAWLAILAREPAPRPSWADGGVESGALYWLDEALAEVLAGVPPSVALAEAQVKASAFVSCMGDHGDAQEAWRTCAQQADPDVVLPDAP